MYLSPDSERFIKKSGPRDFGVDQFARLGSMIPYRMELMILKDGP